MKRETYEIRVEGHLPSGWWDWFGELSLRSEPSGESVLSGSLPDQAALHGVLAKVRDLNLKLVSVTRLEDDAHSGHNVGTTSQEG